MSYYFPCIVDTGTDTFLLIVLYGVIHRLLDRATHKVILGRESHGANMTLESYKNSSICWNDSYERALCLIVLSRIPLCLYVDIVRVRTTKKHYNKEVYIVVSPQRKDSREQGSRNWYSAYKATSVAYKKFFQHPPSLHTSS